MSTASLVWRREQMKPAPLPPRDLSWLRCRTARGAKRSDPLYLRSKCPITVETIIEPYMMSYADEITYAGIRQNYVHKIWCANQAFWVSSSHGCDKRHLIDPLPPLVGPGKPQRHEVRDEIVIICDRCPWLCRDRDDWVDQILYAAQHTAASVSHGL